MVDTKAPVLPFSNTSHSVALPNSPGGGGGCSYAMDLLNYTSTGKRSGCNDPARVSVCTNSLGSVDVHRTHCFVKKTYTAHGWYIERGGTNESVCQTNAGLSTVNNPACQMTTPPPWTVCYDCCQQRTCDRASIYCNSNDRIETKYMPPFMKTGLASTPTSTTTIMTTTEQAICKDTPGIDCKVLNTTNICGAQYAVKYCVKFCGRCPKSANNIIG